VRASRQGGRSRLALLFVLARNNRVLSPMQQASARVLEGIVRRGAYTRQDDGLVAPARTYFALRRPAHRALVWAGRPDEAAQYERRGGGGAGGYGRPGQEYNRSAVRKCAKMNALLLWLRSSRGRQLAPAAHKDRLKAHLCLAHSLTTQVAPRHAKLACPSLPVYMQFTVTDSGGGTLYVSVLQGRGFCAGICAMVSAVAHKSGPAARVLCARLRATHHTDTGRGFGALFRPSLPIWLPLCVQLASQNGVVVVVVVHRCSACNGCRRLRTWGTGVPLALVLHWWALCFLTAKSASSARLAASQREGSNEQTNRQALASWNL
jgi:hypothetical protein